MTNNLEKLHLALFFTKGISLARWHEIGMLGREVALYKRLVEKIRRVSFFTYGDREDLAFRKELGGIRLFTNWYGSEKWHYRLMNRVRPVLWKRPVIIKTNQVHGADFAAQVAKKHGIPLLVRLGYMASFNTAEKHGKDSNEYALTLEREKAAFQNADRIVVTTGEIKSRIVELHSPEAEITVIPNYVDTELFKPVETEPEDDLLCCIGRLTKPKNYHALLEAISGLDVRIIIVGSGPLEKELKELARKLNLRVEFVPRLKHEEIPDLFARCVAYVQPSLYEGHPKTIIEAMAAGMPVIAGDSPGISNMASHGKNAWLVKTDAHSIRDGVKKILGDEALRKILGANAREFVRKNYSLDRVVDMELAVYESMLK